MLIGLYPFLLNKVFPHAKSAISDMPQGGFKLIECALGVSVEQIRSATESKLVF